MVCDLDAMTVSRSAVRTDYEMVDLLAESLVSVWDVNKVVEMAD